jgi:uncharacterized ParB-like nuclease family protein
MIEWSTYNAIIQLTEKCFFYDSFSNVTIFSQVKKEYCLAMKPVILYYSFGGATRAEAKKRAAMAGADVVEVLEAKKRGIFSAFLSGCHRRSAEKHPNSVRFRLIGALQRRNPDGACFGGASPPAFNAALELIPKDKILHVVLCSGGAKRQRARRAQSIFFASAVMRSLPTKM